MMILSPAIVLKEAPRNRKGGRGLFIGALIVLAGLGIMSAAAARRDGWD